MSNLKYLEIDKHLIVDIYNILYYNQKQLNLEELIFQEIINSLSDNNFLFI